MTKPFASIHAMSRDNPGPALNHKTSSTHVPLMGYFCTSAGPRDPDDSNRAGHHQRGCESLHLRHLSWIGRSAVAGTMFVAGPAAQQTSGSRIYIGKHAEALQRARQVGRVTDPDGSTVTVMAVPGVSTPAQRGRMAALSGDALSVLPRCPPWTDSSSTRGPVRGHFTVPLPAPSYRLRLFLLPLTLTPGCAASRMRSPIELPGRIRGSDGADAVSISPGRRPARSEKRSAGVGGCFMRTLAPPLRKERARIPR
jgi:hypothetical protein